MTQDPGYVKLSNLDPDAEQLDPDTELLLVPDNELLLDQPMHLADSYQTLEQLSKWPDESQQSPADQLPESLLDAITEPGQQHPEQPQQQLPWASKIGHGSSTWRKSESDIFANPRFEAGSASGFAPPSVDDGTQAIQQLTNQVQGQGTWQEAQGQGRWQQPQQSAFGNGAHNGSGQDGSLKQQQVLRRRASVRKATTTDRAHSELLNGRHALDILEAGNTMELELPQRDKKHITRSGNSLTQWLGQVTQHSSRVSPDAVLGSIPQGSKSLNQSTGRFRAQQQQKQHSMHSSTRRAVKTAKRNRKCDQLAVHKALRQSITQVRLCILQLQEQQRAQHEAQQILHAMSADMIATIDQAALAVEQQHLQAI